MARLLSLILLFALNGCISAISYGEVPHEELAKNAPCASVGDGRMEQKLFLVTTRLPDCRTTVPALTPHRGFGTHYGMFAAVQRSAKGKLPKRAEPSFSLSNDEIWWAQLKTASERENGKVLVYVHGFRETFKTASADTAQIAKLGQFAGPAILYTWPSRGELLSYGVDQTNMYWDERNFRNFLARLAEQPWVTDITLVAHSLGSRLVISAVEYVDRNALRQDAGNISRIILASPDIDRQEFERDAGIGILAKRMVDSGRRVTIYLSGKDKALGISNTIHGYPRLGRPHCFDPFEGKRLEAAGEPVRCYPASSRDPQSAGLQGLTVIDTTDVSNSSSGHSDYLASARACEDFAEVLRDGSGVEGQRLRTPLPYVFRLAPYAKGEKPDHLGRCNRFGAGG